MAKQIDDAHPSSFLLSFGFFNVLIKRNIFFLSSTIWSDESTEIERFLFSSTSIENNNDLSTNEVESIDNGKQMIQHRTEYEEGFLIFLALINVFMISLIVNDIHAALFFIRLIDEFTNEMWIQTSDDDEKKKMEIYICFVFDQSDDNSILVIDWFGDRIN